MLALAFLVMIGLALVADGFAFHIPRGYIYSSMAFAGAVEVFNVLARRNRGRKSRADRNGRTCGSATMSKVLLVTGGSRGIGAAIVKLAGAQGYDVAINYLRDTAAADALAGEVRAAGRKAIAIQGDMAQEADVTRTFATVDRDLGRLTHLVYNSGTTGGYSRLEEADTEMMRDRAGAQRARRARLRQGRDSADVGEEGRAGRRDRDDLVDGGDARQRRRICLVRGLEGRGGLP